MVEEQKNAPLDEPADLRRIREMILQRRQRSGSPATTFVLVSLLLDERHAWQERAELLEQENARLHAALEEKRDELTRMTAAAERLNRARAHVMDHLRAATGKSMTQIVDEIEAAGGVT